MRDIDVISWCEQNHISLTEYVTNWVVRRLTSRDNWNKIWTQRMHSSLFQNLEKYTPANISQTIQKYSQNIFKKYWDKVKNMNNIQIWWAKVWEKILENFLNNRSKKYSYHISKPYESTSSCSRLSPYITYGCLSIKYVYLHSLLKIEELKKLWDETSKKHIKAIRFFLARIHWQSHFIQKLEDQTDIEFKNLNPKSDTIRQVDDENIIQAFFTAQTGIPYIDATMRQLQQTGWCNFRSRAILVSFICNSCMQPWQAVAPRVAQLFTDYEPGIHYPQFQMQAATTWINAIRIYNPIKNGIEKDSEWKHIYKYLPELKNVPVKYIHEPWKWEHFDTLDYPKPIIDIASANRAARDVLWWMKWKTPKKTKQKILKKHGSRVFRGKKKTVPKKSNAQIALFD